MLDQPPSSSCHVKGLSDCFCVSDSYHPVVSFPPLVTLSSDMNIRVKLEKSYRSGVLIASFSPNRAILRLAVVPTSSGFRGSIILSGRAWFHSNLLRQCGIMAVLAPAWKSRAKARDERGGKLMMERTDCPNYWSTDPRVQTQSFIGIRYYENLE